MAVIKPSDGSVLALAGLAVSAPQPPGSHVQDRHRRRRAQSTASRRCRAPTRCARARRCRASSCATPATSRAAAASRNSFAHSCNSRLRRRSAPRLGAKRLVAAAEKFGFNEQPDIPAAKVSTIPKAASSRTRSPSARRDRPEQGQRDAARDGLGRRDDRQPRRARASPHPGGRQARAQARRSARKVAGQVRGMMIAVVSGGTGTRGGDPGRRRWRARPAPPSWSRPPTSRRTRRTPTAWFVAFAPASNPKVAVAVMLAERGPGRRLRRPDRQAGPAGRALGPLTPRSEDRLRQERR